MNIQEVLFGMDDAIPSSRSENVRHLPGINSYIYEHEIVFPELISCVRYICFIIPGLGINLVSFPHSTNSEIQFMISILKTPSVSYFQCFKALPV